MTDLKDLVARLRAYGDHSATIGDMYRLERDCAAAADAVEQLVAERDGRRPMSSAEGMVQRARAERAEREVERLKELLDAKAT